MALMGWALPQISKILPLDEDSLKQILIYSDSLPKDEAAAHLKDILGDSPDALDFISSFNRQRQPLPQASQSTPPRGASPARADGVPKPKHKNAKKKAPLHALPARQVEGAGTTKGAYMKKEQQDYMTGKASTREKQHAKTFGLSDEPVAIQQPKTTTASTSQKPSTSKPTSGSLGMLAEDMRGSSARSSRQSSPGPRSQAPAKVMLTGGASMHGASSEVNELDFAIRALEMQTDPTQLKDNDKKRACKCMATRHPLLQAAPNCLNCGKIICVKEGLGPCTFCHQPLLSSDEIQSMVRVLREQRGHQRQDAHNAAHKRADVSKAARPFASHHNSPLGPTPAGSDTEAETRAKEHRDKLLGFQSNNARRTRIHDEAADFETPSSGQNIWASPAERALQLKKQQAVLKEQEWAQRPEWEKRRIVASIDLKGGKIIRKMAPIERPVESDADSDAEMEIPAPRGDVEAQPGDNPFHGALVTPVYPGMVKGKGRASEKPQLWRRVQDDRDDDDE